MISPDDMSRFVMPKLRPALADVEVYEPLSYETIRRWRGGALPEALLFVLSTPHVADVIAEISQDLFEKRPREAHNAN